jgi:predicted phage terminase large subunit-like protein
LRQGKKLTLPSLTEWVPTVSPGYEAPRHLAPILRIMEAYRETPFRFVAHAPPRHGKTEAAAIHFIPWVLRQTPEKRIGYITYNSTLAEEKSMKAREVAERAGVELGAISRLDYWTTSKGGALSAVGVGGTLTGRGFDLVVVDDALKDRVEAESALHRERLWDWWQSVMRTRLEPHGSVVVFMTRWHADDLAGRLIKLGWPYVCLPAISEEGSALWPERWPLAQLEPLRLDVGEYTWASLFQGQPRPRGGAVFGDCTTYEAVPPNLRRAIGLDLSYSAKTSSDYSVALTLAKDDAGTFYVVDVRREQVRAPEFKETLRAVRKASPLAPMRWYAYGTEAGSADFIRTTDGKPDVDLQHLESVAAPGDKFIRAQPVAAAWNAGRVKVPRGAPWVARFLEEVAVFTGVRDAHDDMVDALAAAFDLLNEAPLTYPSSRRGEGRTSRRV